MDQYLTGPLTPFRLAAGAAFTTFTTFQDISPTPLPMAYANTWRPGTQVELEAEGEFSTTGTPTLSIGFYFGTAAVVLGQSAAITTGSAAAAWPFHIKYRGVVTAVGATGSMLGTGILDLGTSLVLSSANILPATQALRTVAIDTTANKSVGVGAAWGTSSASNSIKVNHFTALILN